MGRNAGNYSSSKTFEETFEQAKRQNPYSFSSKVADQDNPISGCGMFLGESPWPYHTERRYLRSQARLYFDYLLFTLFLLTISNTLNSIFDYLDWLQNSVSANIATFRLLVQIIPTALVPLVSICLALIFQRYNMMLMIQPLVILTYSGLAAAYLLSPMEVFSTVYPDSFPQSKETCYLVLVCILHSQSGVVPPRSFMAWCFSMIFLSVMHIPLVNGWGGDFDSRMPWAMVKLIE
jgi:hypothetical protein